MIHYNSSTFSRKGFPRCACRSCERVQPTPRSRIALLCPTSCEWNVPFFFAMIRTHIPATPTPNNTTDMIIAFSISFDFQLISFDF